MKTDEEILSLGNLANALWEIKRRSTEGNLTEADVEAALAIEFVAHTPAIKRLASDTIFEIMQSSAEWLDYVQRSQDGEQECGWNS